MLGQMARPSRLLPGLGATAGLLLLGGAAYKKKFGQKGYVSQRNTMLVDQQKAKELRPTIPHREKMISNLKSGKEFDMIIVGGGATGAGIALDASTRGLNVALVEMDDYGSGTSSKSTKLLHGGVRYLEKAFRNLDYDQYKLVCEALKERANLLKISPNLSFELPIMLPVYSWWKLPYYYAGAKVYDYLAGGQALESSYFLSKTKAVEKFPMLKSDNLKGAIVYYDGQHNDSRMNISLILSAAADGASVANHVKVIDLIKDTSDPPKVIGVRVKDMLTGEEWDIHGKGVLSATGPFADSIRQMDDPSIQTIVAPSTGVHVVLPSYYGPSNMGLLDPETTDDRLLFFLPWQKNVIVGTTDVPCKVTTDPIPTEKEISFILDEIQGYLNPGIKIRRGDVLAAWSGLRPLVRDPTKPSSQELARSHVVEVSKSNVVSVAGGKWTTYRSMASDAVDVAVKAFDLKPVRGCQTETSLLVGAHHYSSLDSIKLAQQFGFDHEVAVHLSESYGDRAFDVAMFSHKTGLKFPIFGKRLSHQYPYIEAEVRYATEVEYARTITDVLARRTRLCFLNAIAAKEAIPKVADIMAPLLSWSPEEREKQIKAAKKYLKTMGLSQDRSKYNHNQMVSRREVFDSCDRNKDGHLTASELEFAINTFGVNISTQEFQQYMENSHIEPNEQGEYDFMSYLNLMEVIEHSLAPEAVKSSSSNADRSGGSF